MRIPEHPTQIRRMLDARRARLAPERPVLAATLTQVRKRCAVPTCRCHHGEPHLAWHLTYKVKGTTRTVYVPHDLLDDVRTWIAEHKRIKTEWRFRARSATERAWEASEQARVVLVNGRMKY